MKRSKTKGLSPSWAQRPKGELANLALASPASGTPADLLCGALRRRYAADGLSCKYRACGSIDGLGAAGAVLAEVKYSWLVGRWVAVLGVKDGKVVAADPACGLRRVPAELFAEEWMFRGIELACKK